MKPWFSLVCLTPKSMIFLLYHIAWYLTCMDSFTHDSNSWHNRVMAAEPRTEFVLFLDLVLPYLVCVNKNGQVYVGMWSETQGPPNSCHWDDDNFNASLPSSLHPGKFMEQSEGWDRVCLSKLWITGPPLWLSYPQSMWETCRPPNMPHIVSHSLCRQAIQLCWFLSHHLRISTVCACFMMFIMY